jgi:polyisoprenoid-binding protein YceI
MKALKSAALAAVLVTGSVTAAALLGGAGLVQQGGSAPAVPEGTFRVDAVHSSVIFRIQRTTGAPFYGRFDQISGHFLLDGADLAKSVVDVSIPTASVNSNNSGRDKHLRSQDFFSAEEYPAMTFKSTSVKKSGDNAFEVSGNLTFRGQTKPLTFTAKQTGTGPARGGGTMIGYDLQFTIKRSDFGVTKYAESLGDDVTLMIGLEGVK